jgi:hypothetical protein
MLVAGVFEKVEVCYKLIYHKKSHQNYMNFIALKK